MRTENNSIDYVLSVNATSFFIPPFQRSYSWGRSEIERYFNDILRIIQSKLKNEQDELEHFFGTLVIKEETEGFARKSVVVDGQQRLTTTLLFLIALRDLETDKVKQKFITENYLKNNASTFEDKIKLKQVTKDWDSYRALINNTQSEKGKIYDAYSLFLKLLKNAKFENSPIQFDDYIYAIKKINVAIIFLDNRPFKGEDPQIIFETLNSLGKPLTLSDLIRNYVLLKKHPDEQSQIYEDTWHPKIESVLNENTSNFFREYLQYKTIKTQKVVSDNNTKELYQKFKDLVENKSNFNTNNDFINDIVRYIPWYKWIIEEKITDSLSLNANKNEEIKELIRNIFHDIRADAFIPFALGLIECHQEEIDGYKLTDDMFISILKTIRTYLIRRRVLKLAQGENQNIVLLCKNIKELASGEISMIDLLSDMIYALRMPNDDEIKTGLISINFYEGLSKYKKFILGKIEENNTKVSVGFRNKVITTEHIMPQKLNDTWKKELGDDFENIHKTYLHNIGNLILTEFNQEMGSKSFEEKKIKLNTSSLNFRLDIISKEKWNENSIIEHQGKMINWFLETFSLPYMYKTSSNWNTAKGGESFDEETLNLSDMEDYDFTGMRVIKVDMFNESIPIKNFKELLEIVVNKLYNELPEIFINDDVKKTLTIGTNIPKEKIDRNERYQYMKLNETMFAKVGGYSSNDTIKKLTTLCKIANLDNDDLQIVVLTKNKTNIEQISLL